MKEEKKNREFLFGSRSTIVSRLAWQTRGGLSNNLSSDLSHTKVRYIEQHGASRANFYLRDDPRITGTASSGRTCEILFIAGQQQQ